MCCGLLLGTACLIGLYKVVRGGRCGGHGRCGCRGGGCGGGSCGEGSCGAGGCHGGGGGCHGPRHGGPERWILRGLFHRLDTTPGQEKVILEAVGQVRERARALREEVARTRADVAKIIRAPSVDEAAVAAVHARHDAAVNELRGVLREALGRVHEALDARQRAVLADLLESGGFFHGWGPYRG